MRAIPTLAKRFLLSKSSDGFLSFITWVSVVGVALGVLALTVVTSVINGFEGELARVISGLNGQVVLYSRAEPSSDPRALIGKIQKALPEAEAVSASLITEVMGSGPHGVAGLVLEGVDPETIGLATTLPSRIVKGEFPRNPQEIAMGSAVAEKLGVNVGDSVRLVIPSLPKEDAPEEEKFTRPPSGVPQILTIKVSGIIKIGMHEYDSKYAFATLPWVQEILSAPGKASTFKIKLKKNSNSRQASKKLSDVFGYPFRAKDWTELNQNLFYAIQLEKVVIAIILMAIIVVAAFNVVSTLMMMIHDKTKEIAILKAMGFKASQSFKLFCLVGMGIGSVGTAAGVGLGLLISWILDKTQLISLPADIYYIGFLPVLINWREMGLIAGSAILITFFATVYPAWRVSTQSPMNGIRYE